MRPAQRSARRARICITTFRLCSDAPVYVVCILVVPSFDAPQLEESHKAGNPFVKPKDVQQYGIEDKKYLQVAETSFSQAVMSLMSVMSQ